MKIYLAADHAGYSLKEALKEFLESERYEVADCGAHALDKHDDYNDYVRSAAQAIAAEPSARGIILGGSGQGEAMQANRVNGVRAAVFYGGALDIVKLSREHNDANVLSLAARFVTPEEAKVAVQLWLETPFSNAPRHVRRNTKLDENA